MTRGYLPCAAGQEERPHGVRIPRLGQPGAPRTVAVARARHLPCDVQVLALSTINALSVSIPALRARLAKTQARSSWLTEGARNRPLLPGRHLVGPLKRPRIPGIE
nr:hypothetical protein FFPRI1PSEUD_49020 [Pseudomonas sp. FFPRI_1]